MHWRGLSNLWTTRTWGLFLKSPETFRAYFGCHNSLYIFATPRFSAIKLRNHLGFSYIKNTLKEELFKTGGLQFDNWFFGPEKFSGLLRNRPLVINWVHDNPLKMEVDVQYMRKSNIWTEEQSGRLTWSLQFWTTFPCIAHRLVLYSAAQTEYITLPWNVHRVCTCLVIKFWGCAVKCNVNVSTQVIVTSTDCILYQIHQLFVLVHWRRETTIGCYETTGRLKDKR